MKYEARISKIGNTYLITISKTPVYDHGKSEWQPWIGYDVWYGFALTQRGAERKAARKVKRIKRRDKKSLTITL